MWRRHNGLDTRMTPPETDFLIYYGRIGPVEHATLLGLMFPADEAGAVRHLIEDKVSRARLEFSYNRAIPYEDFLLCQKHGFLRTTDEFKSHTRTRYGVEFPNVCSTELDQKAPISTPGIRDTYRYFAPLVEAYICRHTGTGIVAERTVLEIAIDIGDTEFLALVVDPNTGDFLFPELRKLPRHTPPADNASLSMLRKRRKKLSWWSVDERGVVVHDLTRNIDQCDLYLRMLPWDRPLREVVSGWRERLTSGVPAQRGHCKISR